jgi:hypothetical protein
VGGIDVCAILADVGRGDCALLTKPLIPAAILRGVRDAIGAPAPTRSSTT